MKLKNIILTITVIAAVMIAYTLGEYQGRKKADILLNYYYESEEFLTTLDNWCCWVDAFDPAGFYDAEHEVRNMLDE